MMLVKASEESEAGQMPSEEELAEMGAYNEELAKAGVLLTGEGLTPTAEAYHRVGTLLARTTPRRPRARC
jgi:hypothetical protein